MTLETPVALIIFRRPEHTRRVFERIAVARPRTLLIIGDGPRGDDPEEVARVAETRAITQRVDWPCNLMTNFAEDNLGLKRRIMSGLQWVFDNVEEAIILEDDCVAEPTFFFYCRELLERYREDHRIATVSGENHQNGLRRTPYSYFFSKYFQCSGWATWRRVWDEFDLGMKTWPEFHDAGAMRSIAETPVEQKYWTKIFQSVYDGEVNGWGAAWQYYCWQTNALTINPEVNLITNIGYGGDATHTKSVNENLANLPTQPLTDLRHPPFFVPHKEADRMTYQRIHGKRPFFKKWTRSVMKRLPVLKRRFEPKPRIESAAA